MRAIFGLFFISLGMSLFVMCGTATLYAHPFFAIPSLGGALIMVLGSKIIIGGK